MTAPQLATASSPHIHTGPNVGGVMRRVLYALTPAIAVTVLFYGWLAIVQILLSVAACMAFEALALALRKRPLRPTVSDGSAAVTGLLIALTIPLSTPWWITLIGCLFAILLAKQAYGGIGQNPFNPAMIAFVVLLISFPKVMTQWPAPGNYDFTQALSIIFQLGLPLDAISQATILDAVRTAARAVDGATPVAAQTLADLFPQGDIQALFASGSAWLALAYLAGGLWLWRIRIIPLTIPAGVLAGALAVALPLHLYNPELYADPVFHWLAGGMFLGAFFIATDPVTSPAAPRAMLVYGLAIGALTMIIRSFGAYPDGMAFAVLLANITVPLLDHHLRPTVYGHGQDTSHGRR